MCGRSSAPNKTRDAIVRLVANEIEAALQPAAEEMQRQIRNAVHRIREQNLEALGYSPDCADLTELNIHEKIVDLREKCQRLEADLDEARAELEELREVKS